MGPDHKNRSSEAIISERIYHDAAGFAYRAVSWLDLLKRTGKFSALHYACIDGRLAIEHLMFDQLRVSAGKRLTQHEYQRCLKNNTNLNKLFRQIVPDYERLVAFTELLASLDPKLPKVNAWDIGSLKKDWGALSSYLHWSGFHAETTHNRDWQEQALRKVSGVMEPLWQKLCSGHSGCMQPESMKPPVREIWEKFKAREIDTEHARAWLKTVQPLVSKLPPP